ncbi:hypothetical protein [Pseudomonas sp. CDFA 610]|nr:hypothetical protein [Pseudomonas sp. CDFA 610]
MKEGQALEVEVPGTITIDETRIGVALVTRGVGLMYVPAAIVEPYIAAGSLQRVLED